MLVRKYTNVIFAAVLCFVFSFAVSAQTSEFTFQGKLTDQSVAANGAYDLSFKLYDAANLQIGSTITREDVQVTNGVFTVSLDFGAAAFDGSPRMIEILVRPGSSTGAFTTLAPKLSISSTPYAVKSLKADTASNASQLGGVNANQFVQTDDSRLTDARNPLPGSASYIQNSVSPQQGSNFNVSGNGTVGGTLSANVVDSATQYNLNGSMFIRPTGQGENVSVGHGAGNAGSVNTSVGWLAGMVVSGIGNSSFGGRAGKSITSGKNNSTFGWAAGEGITTGSDNLFFGAYSGSSSGNPMIGSYNAVFGSGAGTNLTTGGYNTLIGNGANVSATNISGSTAIGHGSVVSQNNSVVLGTSSTKIGIGESAPQFKLHVLDQGNTGLRVQTNTSGGTVASFGGAGEFQIDAPGVPAGRLNVKENGTVILGDSPGSFPGVTDRLVVSGSMRLMVLTGGGSTSVCRNTAGQLSSCSSSFRYKSDIVPYHSGLDLIRKLEPIEFKWKDGGMRDFGLGAEAVAEVEPLLVTKNDDGEIEGVKYDRVGVVLVNAVKEQQVQIEAQAETIARQQQQIDAQAETNARQQQQIDALTKLVCAANPLAEICAGKGGPR